MQFKDYYRVLGLEKTASPTEVKKAYRKLARRHHPDVSKDANASARMAEVNEANAVLSDPEKRAAYDQLGRQPHARPGQEFRPPPDWDSRYPRPSPARGEGEFSDFFEQLFGRGAGQRSARAGAGGRHSPVRGEDRHATIELDLQDAYAGAQRTLALLTPRLDKSGHAVDEERHLEVSIPKGIRAGQQIRLAGHGGPGVNGGAPGDLLMEVLMKPDPRWRSEGRDVYQRVPLAPWEAVLGASVVVATPSGDAEVTVPAGWKPGRKLRLKGRGIPGADSGDLYLELDIVLPAAQTEAQRAAYRALGQAFPGFDARRPPGD